MHRNFPPIIHVPIQTPEKKPPCRYMPYMRSFPATDARMMKEEEKTKGMGRNPMKALAARRMRWR